MYCTYTWLCVACDPSSPDSYLHSARLSEMYTEPEGVFYRRSLSGIVVTTVLSKSQEI